MGSLSQSGPSRLFLAFPLSWRPRQPIGRLGSDGIWLDWCFWRHTHPNRSCWPQPGPALRPLASGVSALNSSIVWRRNCLPALRQTASTLMYTILFKKRAIEQSVMALITQPFTFLFLFFIFLCYSQEPWSFIQGEFRKDTLCFFNKFTLNVHKYNRMISWFHLILIYVYYQTDDEDY